MNRFRDKVAIVTGGASGIGGALCEELGRSGARVVIADIDAGGAEQAASSLEALGARVEAAPVDVTCAQALEQLVNRTVSNHGRLDFMFNNAAVAVVGEVRDSNPEHWRRVLDVNLLGVVYGALAAYSVMVRQGFGHIVNVASVTGLIPSPILAHYSTTKWGVIGFSAPLRPEAAGLGVKVSVACPSLVRTNIPDRTVYLNIKKEDYLARLPWRMMMEPGPTARTILRGVARNRALIIFPLHARLLWWCYRLCPALLSPLSRWSVGEFRKMRSERHANSAN